MPVPPSLWSYEELIDDPIVDDNGEELDDRRIWEWQQVVEAARWAEMKTMIEYAKRKRRRLKRNVWATMTEGQRAAERARKRDKGYKCFRRNCTYCSYRRVKHRMKF